MSTPPGSADRVLIAGVGNVFRSDDGFGSAVAGHLLRGHDDRDPVPPGVRVVDYGIRGLHLAFDLAGFDSLILVDTVPDAGGPGSVVVLQVDPPHRGDPLDGIPGVLAVDAHSMEPDSVLRSVVALGAAMPRTIVVGCEPECLDDGIGLGELVTAAVPIAAATALELARSELTSVSSVNSVNSEKGTT